MSDRSLSGRTALVTGASRGIGLATVEALAERGCQVLAGIRQPSTSLEAHFKKLSEEHETRIQPVFVDLANSDRAAECAKQLAQTEGLQILVNNAGIATGGIFQMTSIETVRKMFEVNFFATTAFTQVLLRRLTRTGNASIVNVGSTAGLNGDSGTFAYGASKAALMFATQVMARELGALGIRVNAVAPTVTSTDMADQMTPESLNAMIGAGAIRRPATPREVAEVVCFLASDSASMITGQVIRVDGGQRGR